jgi:hypothetical protein
MSTSSNRCANSISNWRTISISYKFTINISNCCSKSIADWRAHTFPNSFTYAIA